MKTHLAKYAITFNLTNKQYKSALQAWSRTVKKRDNNTCQICNNSSEHAHHILPKSKYPELSLNPNNGIALCVIHHREVHLGLQR